MNHNTKTTKHTPDDVLERTYRRAIEQADAMGVSLAELLTQIPPSTAFELRRYMADKSAAAIAKTKGE